MCDELLQVLLPEIVQKGKLLGEHLLNVMPKLFVVQKKHTREECHDNKLHGSNARSRPPIEELEQTLPQPPNNVNFVASCPVSSVQQTQVHSRSRNMASSVIDSHACGLRDLCHHAPLTASDLLVQSGRSRSAVAVINSNGLVQGVGVRPAVPDSKESTKTMDNIFGAMFRAASLIKLEPNLNINAMLFG